MCTTTTHWETHISTECSFGDTGSCDGSCIEHERECTCSCHNDFNLPETVEGVRDWHDEANSIVVSFDKGDQAEQWELARLAVTVLNKVNAPKQYKIFPGADRTVVAESY